MQGVKECNAKPDRSQDYRLSLTDLTSSIAPITRDTVVESDPLSNIDDSMNFDGPWDKTFSGSTIGHAARVNSMFLSA